ncbi:ribonuclease H-like domain-containing protein [Tanacetum coccineum]
MSPMQINTDFVNHLQPEWSRTQATIQNGKVIVSNVQEKHDFLADSLEEIDDCEDLQIQAITNFKETHIDAYDSDCDDEATANAIFMANLSPDGSLNADMVEPCYDSGILSESFALRNFDLEDIVLESTNSGPTAKLPIIKLGEYENFSATSAKYLDSIFNRLQKIVSRLAILGVIIAQEDLNLKFLSSLPPEWNTHVVVWMNKPEVETLSIDDLYNHFKIVEQKAKKTIGTSSGGQNLALMLTMLIYKLVLLALVLILPVHKFTLQVSQIHEDDLDVMDLKWQLSLLSVRAKKYYQRIGKKIFINSNDIAGYDKSKVECYNCHKLGHFSRECRAPRSKEGQFKNQDNTRKQGNNEDTSKAMLAIDDVGFDWSGMAEEQVQTNMALMAFSDSEVYTDKTCSKTCLKNYETLKKQYDDLLAKLHQTEFKASTYKRGLDTVEAQLVTFRKIEVLFSEEVIVLKREVGCKTYEFNMFKIEFEKVNQEKEGIDFKIKKFENASKDLDKLLKGQITDNSKKGLGYHAVPPPHPLIYNALRKLDLSYSGLEEFHQPEFEGYGLRANKIVCENSSNSSNETKKNSDAPLIKEGVSDNEDEVESLVVVEKKIVVPTIPKVDVVRPKQQEKPVRKPVKYAEMYRQVNTARPKVVVNAVRTNRVNVVKASACWVWRPIKPNSASITLKRYDYVDARKRSRSVMASVPKKV